MSAVKVPTSQREEFKKYIETSGIQEKLVHMLVSLYEEPEKPNDPLAYLKALFEADNLDTADVETLKLENTELKQKLGEANEEIAELKAKVAELSSEGNEEAQWKRSWQMITDDKRWKIIA